VLPSWLAAGARLLAVVISARGGGGAGVEAPRIELSLSLRPDDCENPEAAAMLGELQLSSHTLPPHVRAVASAPLPAAAALPPEWPGAGTAASAATLVERFEMQPAYHHPAAASRVRHSLGLGLCSTCLPVPAAASRSAGAYASLRAEQNRLWASAALLKGVAHARGGRMEEALSSYQHALELDPEHADTYVARGAAHANAGRLHEAMADFGRALRYEPGHANARRYLDATRTRVQQRQPQRSPPHVAVERERSARGQARPVAEATAAQEPTECVAGSNSAGGATAGNTGADPAAGHSGALLRIVQAVRKGPRGKEGSEEHHEGRDSVRKGEKKKVKRHDHEHKKKKRKREKSGRGESGSRSRRHK
jgi:tetratricopeptide (TPR) repeat protein